MKQVLACLLCLLTLAALLTACDSGDQEPPHEHSFDSTWLYDESQHWHAAACEHTELESDRGDHVDADGNDICDVCGYIKDHTHSYDEGWTWNESTHYHKSACGHNVKKDEAKHADDNNDAICDVCTYDYDHTHTYEEAWISKGEEGHWHLPSCGHTVDGSDLTAHADENNDGSCDVCGENGGHEHTYDEAWKTTEDEHWHEVTCGHDIPVADKSVHADENGDTVCDVCGYTPPHFHTFADTLTSDGSNHWYASTCGHDVKKDEAPHSGHETDGVCDVCNHVVFRLYTVTVTVPEYVTVITPDGAESMTFILKENTPASFTLRVPDYAEIVSVTGAKLNGKPADDGEYRIYTVNISGISTDTEIAVTGNKLSAVEMIVTDGQGSLDIVGSFKYAYQDITFTAPSAGRYMIFSTTNEEVQFGLGEMGEDGYPIYTMVYYMDVTEPGEVSLQSRYFPWSVPEGGKLEYTYVVAKIDSEITLSSLRAEGYTLPTNADVTVYFTAPKAGEYQISSSTLGLAWNDYIRDSIVVTATEDNQLMSFTVRYEKTSAPSYVFDCTIVSMEATPLQEGDNTVTAPYGSYLAVSVTATEAGTYMIQSKNPYIKFYTLNENTGTMNGLGGTYNKDLSKGGKFTVYVSVDIYEYDGTDDITDVVTVSYLGYVPSGSDSYNAKVNAMNSYVSEFTASDFVLTAQNGDHLSIDGGNTWAESVQISVADYGFITYWVKSNSGADTVTVTVERIAYEFTIGVGTHTQTMIPGKEYTVFLTGTADDAHYVSYILSWDNADLAVSYSGAVLSSGGTVDRYNEYYSLTMVYNGSASAQITFTLEDPYVSDGGSDNETTDTLIVGTNKVYVTVTDYYCAGTVVTFTAQTAGSYILAPADGELYASVVISDEFTSETITMPYVFTLAAGETIEFTVFTTANMTVTEDTIELVIVKK